MIIDEIDDTRTIKRCERFTVVVNCWYMCVYMCVLEIAHRKRRIINTSSDNARSLVRAFPRSAIRGSNHTALVSHNFPKSIYTVSRVVLKLIWTNEFGFACVRRLRKKHFFPAMELISFALVQSWLAEYQATFFLIVFTCFYFRAE